MADDFGDVRRYVLFIFSEMSVKVSDPVVKRAKSGAHLSQKAGSQRPGPSIASALKNPSTNKCSAAAPK